MYFAFLMFSKMGNITVCATWTTNDKLSSWQNRLNPNLSTRAATFPPKKVPRRNCHHGPHSHTTGPNAAERTNIANRLISYTILRRSRRDQTMINWRTNTQTIDFHSRTVSIVQRTNIWSKHSIHTVIHIAIFPSNFLFSTSERSRQHTASRTHTKHRNILLSSTLSSTRLRTYTMTT